MSKNIFSIASNAYKREGSEYLLINGIKFIINSIISRIISQFYKLVHWNRTFIFNGKKYRYYYHHKGKTWRTERAIEIPIIWDIVNQIDSGNILEIGNVLAGRFSIKHDILDKYEISDGVINEDVISFNPRKRYDLIISISTLEHVGWDEVPKNPTKILQAIENLRKLLAPGGLMVVTMPIGQNDFLDSIIVEGKQLFDFHYYMKRKSNTIWEESTWQEIKDMKYNHHIQAANAIIIGITKNDQQISII